MTAHADVETVAAGRPSMPEASRRPPIVTAASIGRYVVLEELGQGGMGRVLRAYDPRLQREVALKEVRAESLTPETTVRLVAEAQAMAKLSHPNVVAIYDVEDLADDELVLVMEYVPGRTLRHWLRASQHDWKEVLERFLLAGRGLAAAHAAGLLHRDFKPANVLVGEGGVVKVTDFGLAMVTSAFGEVSSHPEAEERTEAGMAAGTPRYMSPEQLEGGVLTSAVDQYSFCVALWEALHGAPPFSGAQLEQKRRGPPPWPDASLPRRVAEAIARGLSPRPEERWPSMTELLGALARDHAAQRRRWLALGATMVVIGGAGSGLQEWSSARAQRCSGAAAHLAGVWDDERRASVRAAMLGVEAPYAARAWERTSSALDEYAQEWRSMYVEACEATTIRGEQSHEVMDLRMACLHGANVELDAAVDLLAEADAQVVREAHEVTGGLRPLSRCSDVEALAADEAPPPPQHAATVEEVRRLIEEATVAEQAALYQQAEAKLSLANERLGAVEYDPVRAEIARLRGDVLEQLGRYEDAEASLRAALDHAARSRRWSVIASAATSLMKIVGDRQQRTNEALRYHELALGLARGEPRLEAAARQALASILVRQGLYEEAEHENRAAIELWEQAVGPRHPSVASALNNLANALGEHGRHQEAEVEHRRALALWEELLGPNHPNVARARNNLAIDLLSLERLSEAEAEHRQALALWEELLGSEHPNIATSRDNLGNVLGAQGRFAEAEVEHRRALELRLRLLGTGHPAVAKSRYNLALDLQQQGRHSEAEVEHRRALELREHVLGPEHLDVAMSHDSLATLLMEQHRLDEAIEHADRAWELRRRHDEVPDLQMESGFLFARLLWATGQRERARAVVEEALAGLSAAGQGSELAESARAWLADHTER